MEKPIQLSYMDSRLVAPGALVVLQNGNQKNFGFKTRYGTTGNGSEVVLFAQSGTDTPVSSVEIIQLAANTSLLVIANEYTLQPESLLDVEFTAAQNLPIGSGELLIDSAASYVHVLNRAANTSGLLKLPEGTMHSIQGLTEYVAVSRHWKLGLKIGDRFDWVLTVGHS